MEIWKSEVWRRRLITIILFSVSSRTMWSKQNRMSCFFHSLDRNSESSDASRNFVSDLMQVDVSTINKIHVICVCWTHELTVRARGYIKRPPFVQGVFLNAYVSLKFRHVHIWSDRIYRIGWERERERRECSSECSALSSQVSRGEERAGLLSYRSWGW